MNNSIKKLKTQRVNNKDKNIKDNKNYTKIVLRKKKINK
jgi:hypothetical protein